jgi:uncharacterized protein (TIGR00369 family)
VSGYGHRRTDSVWPVEDPAEQALNPDGLSLLELLRAADIPISDAFLQSEVETRLGLQLVELSPERVVIRMPVGPAAFNSSGNLHGGAIATLVDVSAGMVAAVGSGFRPGIETIVTADLHVRYLGRAKGDAVIAESRVLRAGKMLVVVECVVRDTLDNVIAVADFSSMIVPLRDPLPSAPTSTRQALDL